MRQIDALLSAADYAHPRSCDTERCAWQDQLRRKLCKLATMVGQVRVCGAWLGWPDIHSDHQLSTAGSLSFVKWLVAASSEWRWLHLTHHSQGACDRLRAELLPPQQARPSAGGGGGGGGDGTSSAAAPTAPPKPSAAMAKLIKDTGVCAACAAALGS
eukprot:COSAG01_NODE_4488_length_4979_cov_4.046293_5_plen_158_part_00